MKNTFIYNIKAGNQPYSAKIRIILNLKIFFVVLFMLSVRSLVFSKEISKETLLWQEYHASGELVEEKTKALKKLIDYYERYDVEINNRDSITNLVLDLALHCHDVDVILRAYTLYFEGYNITTENSQKHLKNIKQLATNTSSKIILWHALHFESQLNFEKQEFLKSIELDKQALHIARELNKIELELKCLLKLGQSYDWNGNRDLALQNYLQALDLAKRENLSGYIVGAYAGIARMFYATQNFAKSIEYSEKCIDLILSNSPVDSLLLIDQQYHILDAETNINFNEELERKIEEQIDFAIRKKYTVYHRRLWTLYRSNLIENLRYGKLFQLYNVKYPEEFVNAKAESSDLYLRLKAYFHEYQGNLDSAKYYWAEAKTYIDETNNVYLKAHHYNRYAEFLIRAEDYDFANKMAPLDTNGHLILNSSPFNIRL